LGLAVFEAENEINSGATAIFADPKSVKTTGIGLACGNEIGEWYSYPSEMPL